MQAQQLRSLERPSDRDYQSVANVLECENPPLLAEDRAWIFEREDLVTLRPGRENAWLDGVVERILYKCHCNAIEVRSFLMCIMCP